MARLLDRHSDAYAYQQEHHQVMRRLNDQITADERMDSVMLPLRDGITIARKR
jgi:predicted O-methyltransferase YrrM